MADTPERGRREGLLRPVIARDPGERHRAATPLELLYDLCFVVAIAQAAVMLHHAIAEGHGLEGAVAFGLIFFAIWWAWMGFTWFASAFDNDDALYRVKVLIQMCGVLVLAAGVPRAFKDFDYTLVTVGYAIMRLGMVSQWLRAAKGAVPLRKTAMRYAIGIAVCQIGWIAMLFAPTQMWIYGWFVLAPLELAVPIWAERAAPTTWHPHHIAERYGLMTIIVIGESVLAATIAMQTALDSGHLPIALLETIVSAPLIFFSMWWLYFASPHHARLTSNRSAFRWGYAHYFTFAAAAAAGAGIAACVDVATEHAHVSGFWAGQSVSMAIVVYLLSQWYCQRQTWANQKLMAWAYVCAMVLLLGAPFASEGLGGQGAVLVCLTALVVHRARSGE